MKRTLFSNTEDRAILEKREENAPDSEEYRQLTGERQAQ